MKPLVRVLALTAALGFTGISMAHATFTSCRYFCGRTIYQMSADNCCSQTFTCPNGQSSTPFAYLGESGWQFC
jgi:hypothetical protein